MKKIKFIVLIIIALLNSTFLSAQILNDCVGYWPFNGNADDESGNGNNGIVNGPILASDRFNNPNSAYYFDGVNDFINCGNNSICNEYTEFTLTIWIKPEIEWVNYNLQNFVGNMNGKQGFMIYEGADKIQLYGGDGSTDWLFIAGTGVTPQKGIWNFFAFAYKDGVISFYHNDVLLGQSNALRPNGKISASLNNFLIGKGEEWNKGFFKGTMDDICIFNRALTETEIQQLYTGNSTPVIGFWSQSGSNIFYNNGNVGIGTTNTFRYKLAVNGTIGAKEVIVETTSTWSDFVFEPTYKLMPLKELNTYIQENKHLPEIPTTAEVKEKGISIGEMNSKLLQKIEELTLYIIEQEKRIQKLENKK